jgi:hypothetical protein
MFFGFRQSASEGVRPSPGAALLKDWPIWGFIRRGGSADAPAPEDGRTPTETANVLTHFGFRISVGVDLFLPWKRIFMSFAGWRSLIGFFSYVLDKSRWQIGRLVVGVCWFARPGSDLETC